MHQGIVDEYRDYVQSFQKYQDPGVREFIENELVNKNSLWPDALIQVNQSSLLRINHQEK
jgi:hypothetical protein